MTELAHFTAETVENRSVDGRIAARWRAATIAAIVTLAAIGWTYLFAAAASGHFVASLGPGMALVAPWVERLGAVLPGVATGHGQPGSTPFGAIDLAAVLAMWLAMMLAMMLPTAAPTLRAYAGQGRMATFVGLGYLAVWGGAAVAAALLQVALVTGGALAPQMAPAGVALSASVLVAAGVYQFTPLKLACLIRCRNPHAATANLRTVSNAVRLGLEEGLACLGCCWAMMAVMFAAGLMNLVAMAFLGALMALEKLVSGVRLTYGLGAIMFALGVGLASSMFIR